MLAGRYRIERELGKGGMAVVYLAIDTKHDRQVAIKVLGDALSSAVGAQRFEQEIKLTAGLQHPHILPAYDSGVGDDGTLFYVMPYVEGGSLRRRLDEKRQLPLSEVVHIARDVSHGLAYAHARGVVHRDIKPENILFLGAHAVVADFGIARLLSTQTAERLTAQGNVVGTPGYMSPEQAFGLPVDARADEYSVACVLYEALAGSMPFDGFASGVLVGQGITRFPVPLSARRSDLASTESLDAVFIKALAPDAEQRYPDVASMVDALEVAAFGRSAAQRSATMDTPGRRTPRRWAPIAIATLVAIGVTGYLASPARRDQLLSLGRADLDSTRVFVAPFQSSGTATTALVRSTERRIRDELQSWTGLQVVAHDAPNAGETLTLASALAAARSASASTLIWGSGRADRGGPRVQLQLYDVRSGASQASVTDSVGSVAAASTLATLLAGDAPAAALRAAGTTHSLPAWRAYVRGHRALGAWRLASADSAFAASAAADVQFPAARAWYAQTRVWERRGARADWRRPADEALTFSAKLHPVDAHVAHAVAALGARNDPSACANYSALVKLDSLSPIGWLGLGDCQALDSIVVASPRSPSGFAFRGSLSRATMAYERAVRLAPGAYAALPLFFVERLLPTQSDRYRPGIDPAATRVYAARPSLTGDTIAYVPRQTVASTLPPEPPKFEEALERNRTRMFEYVSAWIQRAPSSTDAYEALASIQETRGELTDDAVAGRPSALSALDSARRFSGDPAARARLAASRVRILLKDGKFDRARAAVDTALANPERITAVEAHWYAGLAALTGRHREASRLAIRSSPPAPPTDWDTLPAPLASAASLLLLHAASGACGVDSLVEVVNEFEQVDRLIDSYSAPVRRELTRALLTARPRRLAVPCLGVDQVAQLEARSPWDRMQMRLARHDTAGVKAVLDTVLSARRFRRPGGTALDFTFMEAWHLAAVGDTTAAIRHIDLTLNGLPTLSRNAVWELVQSATVGRVMAWRADLARARRDAQTGKRWASAVVALWKNADTELQPVVKRMTSMAAPTR